MLGFLNFVTHGKVFVFLEANWINHNSQLRDLGDEDIRCAHLYWINEMSKVMFFIRRYYFLCRRGLLLYLDFFFGLRFCFFHPKDISGKFQFFEAVSISLF